MHSRILSLSLAAIVALAACAPSAKEARPGRPAEPGVSLILPEPPKEPSAEKIKKPSHPVTIEGAAGAEKFIILNFDNADIQTVISTFGELLEINYILTPGISGTVTIQSYKKFPMRDLFRIFQTILEINGLAAVKDGDLYRIVPIDSAKVQPMDVEKGKEISYRLDDTFRTQLIPLQFVKASEIADLLRSIMPRGTDLVVYEPANILIVTAQPYAMMKFMKVLEAIDIPESETDAARTFVYHVENGEAKKLADILNQMYSGREGATAMGAAPAKTSAVPGAVPGAVGQVKINAYEDINALIVTTTPRSYYSLLEVLKRLDIPPKQVLIEVMIAEVTLSDGLEYGIEWLVKSTSNKSIGGFNKGSIDGDLKGKLQTGGLSGVIYGTIDGDKFTSVVTALAANTKIKVLASPHILAMDNKEANIHIGDEVPIATGLSQQPSTGGGTTLVSTGQIQYKTVGTILTVTPRITEKEMVTLDITQEVSQIGAEVPVAGQNFASFSSRKANTTAVVKSGQTLILGGLITESENATKVRVPVLSRIPIIGELFTYSTYKSTKTELMLLVTPHVINDHDDSERLTEAFRNRIRTIRASDIEFLSLDLEEKTEGTKKTDPAAGEPKAAETKRLPEVPKLIIQ